MKLKNAPREREVMKKSRYTEEQVPYGLRLAKSGTPAEPPSSASAPSNRGTLYRKP